MKTEFTPGPWHINEYAHHTVIGTETKNVAKIISADIDNPGEIRANARLIATAPEMYEVLDKMIYYPGGVSTNEILRVLKKAREV